MSKITVDGRDYEEVFRFPANYRIHEGEIVIKPVKAEPKYLVDLSFYQNLGTIIEIRFDDIPADQAQLMREAVEALMEGLFSDMKDFPNDVTVAYFKARHSIKGDK